MNKILAVLLLCMSAILLVMENNYKSMYSLSSVLFIGVVCWYYKVEVRHLPITEKCFLLLVFVFSFMHRMILIGK